MHADYRNGALGIEAIPSAFSTGVYPLSGTNERPCPGYVRFFSNGGASILSILLPQEGRQYQATGVSIVIAGRPLTRKLHNVHLFVRSQVDLFLITMNDDYRKTPIWVDLQTANLQEPRTQPNKPVP